MPTTTKPMPDSQAQPDYAEPRPDFKAKNAARKAVRRKGRGNHGRPKAALGGRAHQEAKAASARLRAIGLKGASDNTKARFRDGMQRLRAISSGGG